MAQSQSTTLSSTAPTNPYGPAAPDQQLPAPPLLRQVQQWTRDARLHPASVDPVEVEAARLEAAGLMPVGGGAQALARFQTLARSVSIASHKGGQKPPVGGGSVHAFAKLQTLAAGSGRPLEPLLQAVVAGERCPAGYVGGVEGGKEEDRAGCGGR